MKNSQIDVLFYSWAESYDRIHYGKSCNYYYYYF